MNATLHDTVARALGFAPREVKPTGWTRFPTTSRPSNRDGWMRVLPSGVVRFGCWRQGITGWWRDGAGDPHPPQRAQEAMRQALDEDERRLRRQARINEQTFCLALPLRRQSPIGRYLAHRGLGKLIASPPALRMASLPYFHDGSEIDVFPVMLGAVTSPEGTLVALHRTYVSEDGRKAAVPQPKKLSRTSGVLAGASIKLHPPLAIDNKSTLGVAEGIETALACYLASGIPTWSCVSAGMLRNFQWPSGLNRLIVYADNDASGVGQAAARDLAGRAAAAGLECRVLIPEIPGTDWLDVYVGDAA